MRVRASLLLYAGLHYATHPFNSMTYVWINTCLDKYMSG